MNEIDKTNDFILSEYYKVLNMLECGMYADISKLKNAASIRDMYILSSNLGIDINDTMPNMRYYISCYKL